MEAAGLVANGVIHIALGRRTGLIVCCGSVFVAADMREALAKLKPTLFATGDWVFEAASEPALLM